MHSFSSLYNENTVILREYTGPLDFDITGVDCISVNIFPRLWGAKHTVFLTSFSVRKPISSWSLLKPPSFPCD